MPLFKLVLSVSALSVTISAPTLCESSVISVFVNKALFLKLLSPSGVLADSGSG